MAQDGIRWPYHVAQHPDAVAGLTEQVWWPLEEPIAGPAKSQYLEGLRYSSAEGFMFSESASNTWWCSSHSQELRGWSKVVPLKIVRGDTKQNWGYFIQECLYPQTQQWSHWTNGKVARHAVWAPRVSEWMNRNRCYEACSLTLTSKGKRDWVGSLQWR